LDLKNKYNKMEHFEIKKINDKKYFLTLINGNEDFSTSNGMSFEKTELYELYIKLREIFSNEANK
jgi:hypothetical protein